jgi:hypothetical protein
MLGSDYEHDQTKTVALTMVTNSSRSSELNPVVYNHVSKKYRFDVMYGKSTVEAMLYVHDFVN